MNEIRPMFGEIIRQNGKRITVLFEQTDDPTVFRGVHVNGHPVDIYPGDCLQVDVIGPGQAVTFGCEEGNR